MSQLFSTDVLPAGDRIDAWQWNAQQICGDCRIQLPKAAFHGSIDIRNVGVVKLTRFSSSPLNFWKWPCDTSTPDNRACIVITQMAGVRTYLQAGESVLLKPGDSTIIDPTRPWSSTCTTDCTRLYLRVPRWMMENRLQRRELPFATRIPGNASFGAALCRLSQSIYDEAETMGADEKACALDAYFELLAACVGGSEVSRQCRLELNDRIQRFVESHIADPAMGPAEIAAAMEISVRHLHRLFSATGKTLAEYIRGRRLEGCRSDLANPRLRDQTITEIAFRWGFSDSAHFSHSFVRRFGMSPRAFRLQTANEDHKPGGSSLADLAGASDPDLSYFKPN